MFSGINICCETDFSVCVDNAEGMSECEEVNVTDD